MSDAPPVDHDLTHITPRDQAEILAQEIGRASCRERVLASV